MRFVRSAVCCVLLWQAVAGVWPMVVGARHGAAALPLAQRLTATTAERMARALGADAALHDEVRRAVPPGTTLLTQTIQGKPEDYRPEELIALAHKNGVIDKLAALLYPDPWVTKVDDPQQVVEQMVARQRPAALLWMPGDRRPTGPGWTLDVEHDGKFEVWRFQAD